MSNSWLEQLGENQIDVTKEKHLSFDALARRRRVLIVTEVTSGHHYPKLVRRHRHCG